MVAGGESHPTTAGGKLIELEYLAHLENMAQTKRAFLVEPTEGIEALEPLAGQGKIVASQILQDKRVLMSKRIGSVHPKIQGAFVERNRLELWRARQHSKSQVIVTMRKTLIAEGIIRFPIRNTNIGTHGTEPVEKIWPKSPHHAKRASQAKLMELLATNAIESLSHKA